jgi:serine/threonine-protein kinase
MAVVACPEPEVLAAFARGDLAGPDLAAVAEHIGRCAACCRALGSVPADSLAGLARAAAVAHETVQSSGTPSSLVPNPNAAANVPAELVGHPRYRVIGELGAGGMGVVYKAEHRVMGRIVALKVVAPNLTARAGAVERFRKEVRAAAQLSHNNIVRAHDAEEAGGLHFLVMEFIEGVSLDRLVAKKGPLPVPLACLLARQAALGLQHAAEKGMVHRDIKPQNLMVTRKGQVKILDFGIARFVSTDDEPAPNQRLPFGAGRDAAHAGATNPNLLMGTPDYLSPEQAKNSHDVDPRSDIYSLGCTLYFMLTGHPPFGAATTLVDKLFSHTHDEPPPVRVRRPEVPEGLLAVLARMTAKAPDDRYQKAAEAAAALLPYTRSGATEPAFEVVVTPAPRGSPLAPTPVSDTAPQPGAPTLAELARPRKRKRKKPSWWARRKWAVVGGAAALCVLVAGVLAVAKKPVEKTEKPADPGPTESAKAVTPAGVPKAKDEKGGKSSAWTPPVVVAPPKDNPKVLFVLPSSGVWLGDYTQVRRRLEDRGTTVVTASTDGGSSKPFPDPRYRGEPVPIDKLFTTALDLSEYSALAFFGHSADEYMFSGRGRAAAARALQKMQQAGKPIAAISLGQGVLAFHGVLKGKHAAGSDPLWHEYPVITGDSSGIIWDRFGLTVDGKIITATGGREAEVFADAILKAIDK